MEHFDDPSWFQQVIEPQSTYRRSFTSVGKKDDPGRPQIDEAGPPRAHLIDLSPRINVPNLENNSGRPGYSHQKASFGSQPTIPHPIENHIMSMFQDARDVNINGNPHFLNVGKMNFNNYDLAPLKESVSFSALHDSSEQDPDRKCHPDTRESILKQMQNWIDDPNTPERILWLHGPAGVGKSAIAQTISNTYGRDKLAATFFFFRSDPNRNDGNRLFPTLAWQLTKSIPQFRDHIAKALGDDPDLSRKAIEIQFDHLIFRPLKDPQVRNISPVVVIDGVDECSGDKLQQRFVKAIGMAVTDKHFPLRFLISSRPEAHISDAFNQISCPIRRIDLAEIDGWWRDIEKYLMEEFSRIALEQQFDAKTWPGQKIIHNFVNKSSGQFVYASTVIRFVGDEYSSASSQLGIIMGLRPTDGASPFAYLDALYADILQRQPHQKFLKDFLAIFVARSLLAGMNIPSKDEAILLNVDQHELRRKLRGMHSVLKFRVNDHIDLHHRSFLDFLQDPGRSGQYHIDRESCTRRYFELITDALVRYASRTMKNDDCDGIVHFSPGFGELIALYPRKINLPLQDWEKTLQPLFRVKNDWLKWANLNSPWKRSRCSGCTGFYIIDNLLMHLWFFRGTSYSAFSTPPPLLQSLGEDSCTSKDASEGTLRVGHRGPIDLRGNELDEILASFLAMVRTIKSKSSMTRPVIDLIQALLRVDPSKTASRVRSTSDAECIIEFIFNVNKHWDQAVARNAARLGFAIYARVPFLPLSLFINRAGKNDIERRGTYQGKAIGIWPSYWDRINTVCQITFMWGMLSHSNICPLLGIFEGGKPILYVFQTADGGNLHSWRHRSNPPISVLKERMLEVAKAVQYMHSLGVSILNIPKNQVFIDSNLRAKVLGHCLSPQFCAETPFTDASWTYESDVTSFGFFLRENYLNTHPGAPPNKDLTIQRPTAPMIPDNVWQLIQRCLSADTGDRPTMDEVVQEVESWT